MVGDEGHESDEGTDILIVNSRSRTSSVGGCTAVRGKLGGTQVALADVAWPPGIRHPTSFARAHTWHGCLDFSGRLARESCDRPLQSLLRTSFVCVCVHVESGGSLQAMKAMKAMKAARLPARDVADPLLQVVSLGMPRAILPWLKGS